MFSDPNSREALSLRYLLTVILFVTSACYAQEPGAAPSPAFETASIHPAKLTPGCFSMLPPGGVQYAVTCLTLRNFIEIAYGTGYIEGGGSALDEYYDFRAKVPDDKPWNSSTIAPMMKQFLIERFHLVVHSGTRELSGYALMVGRSGSKLKATQADTAVQGQKAGESSDNFTAPGYVQGRSLTVKGIAGLLSTALHTPVVDHTGLTGIYNVDLRYAPESLPGSNPSNESNANLPSFFTALEEQLGLRLQSQKVAVDTVVVDHADAQPTTN
jgi:uncharacterized protein (TIGR03435 family)